VRYQHGRRNQWRINVISDVLGIATENLSETPSDPPTLMGEVNSAAQVTAAGLDVGLQVAAMAGSMSGLAGPLMAGAAVTADVFAMSAAVSALIALTQEERDSCSRSKPPTSSIKGAAGRQAADLSAGRHQSDRQASYRLIISAYR
jgi:hypothetical protein